MMGTNIEKIYSNLNELLEDICKFLSSDKLGQLSTKDKKLVDSLINRSKKQLQEIAKIQPPPIIDEYVDMDKNKDDTNANVETIIEEEPVYPYKDLPAKEASQDVKDGVLSMKRRFILGFEKMKRVYGSIHNEWLLIYCNDKELKPICTFDLKIYEAKATESDKISNFELMSNIGDKKVYYFMALTHKDKLQWVSAINKCHDDTVLRGKGIELRIDRETINEDDDDENYHAVRPISKVNNKNLEEEDDEEIYLEIDPVPEDYINKNHVETPTIRPSLPPGRPTGRHLPTPVAPPVVRPLPKSPSPELLTPNPPPKSPLAKSPLPESPYVSEESLDSYDPIGEEDDKVAALSDSRSKSLDDEFSEDDDDDSTYETFCNVRENTEKLKESYRNQMSDANRISENGEGQFSAEEFPPAPQEFSSIAAKLSPSSELPPPLPESGPLLPLKPHVRDKPSIPKKPSIKNGHS